MGIPQQHEAVARLDGAQRRRDLVVVGPPVALAPLGHLGVVRALALTIDLRHVEGLQRRSEEHTSELQSLMRISYAVFCLKKKNKKNKQDNHYQTHTIQYTLTKLNIISGTHNA